MHFSTAFNLNEAFKKTDDIVSAQNLLPGLRSPENSLEVPDLRGAFASIKDLIHDTMEVEYCLSILPNPTLYESTSEICLHFLVYFSLIATRRKPYRSDLTSIGWTTRIYASALARSPSFA